MTKFASGKRAFGFCERSGFRYPLSDMVEQVVQGRYTGLMVGRDEVDEDHPQNFLDRVSKNLPDPELLRRPRPDLSLIESRAMFSWNPAGQGGLLMTASAGRVVGS